LVHHAWRSSTGLVDASARRSAIGRRDLCVRVLLERWRAVRCETTSLESSGGVAAAGKPDMPRRKPMSVLQPRGPDLLSPGVPAVRWRSPSAGKLGQLLEAAYFMFNQGGSGCRTPVHRRALALPSTGKDRTVSAHQAVGPIMLHYTLLGMQGTWAGLLAVPDPPLRPRTDRCWGLSSTPA
jgi:hypothetical protein